MNSVALTLISILLLCTTETHAQWEFLGGPAGVRSLAIVDSQVFAGTYAGLFLLKDEDTSWVKLNTETMRYFGGDLAVIGSRLFIGAGLGVFVTTDYGSTWDSVHTGLKQKSIIYLVSDTSGNLWVSTNEGLFLSTDLGKSWTLINDEWGFLGYLVKSIAVSDSIVVLATRWNGVQLSRDKGKTWTEIQLNDSLVQAVGSLDEDVIISDGLIFGPFNGFSGSAILTVPRQANSWQILHSGLPKELFTTVLAAGPPGYIYTAAYKRGVFLLSNQGGFWMDTGSGLTDSLVYTITYSNMRGVHVLYAGTDKGVWRRITTVPHAPPVPETPELFFPPDNATSMPLNSMLEWKASLRATSYRLQISTDQTFQTTVVDVNNLVLTSPQTTNLLFSTKYYWRVNAANATGTSGWSIVWSFTTAVSPDIPKLLLPQDNATNVPVDATFAWNAAKGAEAYSIRISADASFMPPLVFSRSGITDTTLTVSGLPFASTLYWIVNASNASGSSAWSIIWSFTTVMRAPAEPTLLSPLNAEKNVSRHPSLIWNASPIAQSYRVQVSLNPSFSPILFDQDSLSGTSLALSNLASSTVHYWKVKATNAGGSSAWSEIWSFTTASINEIGSPPILPQDIELHQNHPNPFAEKTTIRFKLVVPDRVTLEVFDLFGRWVATLVDEKREAGEHSVVLNAARLSNGIYVYRLTANGRSSMKLAVVAK